MKQMEDNLIERFKKLVADHTGLRIREEDDKTFSRALSMQMKKLKLADPLKYLSFLESDTRGSEQEWRELIVSITTGESYFFRDKGHFFLLRNTILPELIKKKETDRSLRIWSAGCSTGEEAYSIAILLSMLLPDLKKWNILIIGTDINEESLKKAEQGIYSQWSFRILGREIKESYFSRNQNGWEIDEEIKKMVNFRYGNLIEDESFPANSEITNMDIIICRNVFIYFEREAVSDVLQRFKRILNPEGYLITGHTELYGHNLASLRQVMYPEAMIYIKTADPELHNPEILRVTEYIKEIKDVIIRKIPAAKLALAVLKKSIIGNTPSPNREIEELIKKGEYNAAAARAGFFLDINEDDYELILLTAKALANSGDYDKAADLCRRAVNINSDSADPYFLLAHISEAKGDDEEAKNMLKKAIYLDPAYVAAYCELGSLYEKGADIPRAVKARSAAIEFLKHLPSRSHVKEYDITAGELLEHVEYLTSAKVSSFVPAGAEEKYRR